MASVYRLVHLTIFLPPRELPREAVWKGSRRLFVCGASLGDDSLQVCGKITWCLSGVGTKAHPLAHSVSCLQFYHLNRHDYKDLVVEKNFRPPIDRTLTPRLQEVIKECWDPDTKKRPTFDRIALLLRTEYQELSIEGDKEMTRSERLIGQSVRSFRVHSKK